MVWENKENVFHTTIPFTRVGWASLAGDSETGNAYLFSVDGLLTCYNGETGKVVWQHRLFVHYTSAIHERMGKAGR